MMTGEKTVTIVINGPSAFGDMTYDKHWTNKKIEPRLKLHASNKTQSRCEPGKFLDPKVNVHNKNKDVFVVGSACRGSNKSEEYE